MSFSIPHHAVFSEISFRGPSEHCLSSSRPLSFFHSFLPSTLPTPLLKGVADREKREREKVRKWKSEADPGPRFVREGGVDVRQEVCRVFELGPAGLSPHPHPGEAETYWTGFCGWARRGEEGRKRDGHGPLPFPSFFLLSLFTWGHPISLPPVSPSVLQSFSLVVHIPQPAASLPFLPPSYSSLPGCHVSRLFSKRLIHVVRLPVPPTLSAF